MMLNILAGRHAPTLASFALSNVLIAFDYDGTLAPIARHPDLARMRRRTRQLLTAVARRYPAVVISGRARSDLVRCVGGVPVWHLAGNHGLEPWGQNGTDPAEIQDWVRHLEQRLAAYDGVIVEDKRYSVTIHYRHASSRRRALSAITRAVRGLRGGRTIGGICAVSVVPRHAPDKGDALERARQLLVCDTAIYVGDDDTDEDVFGGADRQKVLAVRVGRCAESRAPYYLNSQRDVDAFMERLLSARPLRGARS